MAVVKGVERHFFIVVLNTRYIKERDNVSGTTSWRCRHYKSQKCKARIVTSGLHVLSERQPDHNHYGNGEKALARKAVGDMKEKMTEISATPSTSQGAVSAALDDNVLMALPKRATLTRALQRHRQKVACVGHAGNPLPAVPTDMTFDTPDQFRGMVLYDSGPGNDRTIIIGCPELLDGLARADVWLADGTFQVVPGIFFQLYSVHFNFCSGISPAAIYCLLPNKTGDTYRHILQELHRLIPLAAPRTILLDFERAAMNAFQQSYPDARIAGCYFHLCQSVIRRVNELGLKTDYENNDAVRMYVRCLAALAFVPPEDVLEAFELLTDGMPEVDRLDELTTFYEHTYIRGRRQRGRGGVYGPAMFSIEMWNKYAAGVDGIARTTNSVEGWHHALQSLFQCHHPTLWTFMEGLRKDMQKQKAVFLQGAAGAVHLSAKRYRVLNERVQRAVANYGRAEVLVYLRAIAHLSHS
jgi:hypothetical protein